MAGSPAQPWLRLGEARDAIPRRFHLVSLYPWMLCVAGCLELRWTCVAGLLLAARLGLILIETLVDEISSQLG